MLEAIYHLSPYAPVVILIAATLDIFFATGLVLYGAAMMSSVAMMYATGMISWEMIIVSAYSGTILGNTLNYGAGRLFGEIPLVEKRLRHPRLTKAHRFLESQGLFLYVLVGRFITFTRPLYALLLGSLEISFRRWLIYELAVAFFWVCFWLFILIQGEAFITNYF